MCQSGRDNDMKRGAHSPKAARRRPSSVLSSLHAPLQPNPHEFFFTRRRRPRRTRPSASRSSCRRVASARSAARSCWIRAEGHGSPTCTGRELLDAFAGLWCVNIGYGQESVVEAATNQMRKLPYATGYFGFASEPAIRLAAKLVEIDASLRLHARISRSAAPRRSTPRCASSCSTGMRAAGRRRSTSSRSSAATTARRPPGAGLTALPVFHRGFDLPLPTQHYIPSPNPYRHPAG